MQNTPNPITVCWISDFAFEWQNGLPEPLKKLPRGHPMSWQPVLLNEIKANPGLKLHVIALRKKIERDISFEIEGAQFHVLKTIGGTRAPSIFWSDTFLIRKKLAELNPDVVHAWGTERGAGLVATRMRYPYVLTIQGLLTWYQEVTQLSWLERFSAFWERVTLKRAALATTESTFAVRFLKERFPQLAVRQIEHAPNWIFHQMRRTPQLTPLRFIFVGSFNQRKGADLLLHSLDQLKDELNFELMVLGFAEPELKESLASSVSAELWNRIKFRQRCTPLEVAEELARATMMIFPTRADTSPNAVKEAVVVGVPVIASRIGGIPDYVFPGRNGLLFTSENVAELVASIRAACNHPLFSKGLVEPEACAQAREYLSPALMAQQFLAVYKTLAESRRLTIGPGV